MTTANEPVVDAGDTVALHTVTASLEAVTKYPERRWRVLAMSFAASSRCRPQGRHYIDDPVTTMPNDAEPVGRDVGEDGSSVRLPPRTLNPLTLLAPVPTT